MPDRRIAGFILVALIGLTPSVSGLDTGDLDDTTHVLFLGNSYTAGNNLPQLFTDLAESGGKLVETDRNTPGGSTLLGHSQNSATLEMIARGGWDYVVLQEQSQMPTIEYYFLNYMVPGAVELDRLIREVDAETMLFMTWGREFGGRQEIGGHSSPDFHNFFEMQEALRDAYEDVAWKLYALVAPVGLAWQRAMFLSSPVDLWTGDHSHPTYQGSYLAACVFYASIFDESPVGLRFTGPLPAETAHHLQFVAHRAVFDGSYAVAAAPGPGSSATVTNPNFR